MSVGFAVLCTEVMNCCFPELEKMWWKDQSKTLSFFFFFLNVSPSRSQQFFSQLLPVMVNTSEGCMRWLVDNSARFLRHSGRLNQETKSVHLEQGEILWSWLRAVLVVFRLSLFVQQSKNPLLSTSAKPCFPLLTYFIMSWHHSAWAMKLQCHYDVWCQSLTRYTLIIWLTNVPCPNLSHLLTSVTLTT